MSHPFHDYAAGPSCSDSAHWHSQQNMSYDYQSPYDAYPSGARAGALGESGSTSGFPNSATFSPSYDYSYSPEMFSFDEFESSSPLSPSSSSSSCSDAPITPYYQTTGGLPLPRVPLLYTGLDAPVDGEYRESVSPVASAYRYEGWDEEDATQTYSTVTMPDLSSAAHASAVQPEYDTSAAATLWACKAAIAQFQYFDASPTSAPAPDPPIYATYPSSDFAAVTSSAVSPLHAHEYPSLHPPVSCLSPALLSCPPLKLHQPQPRRSIPVVSLSALASASSEDVSQPSTHFERATSPALSLLELQFPGSPDACMTSYSVLPSSADALPMAAYPPRCPCPECTDPYSIS